MNINTLGLISIHMVILCHQVKAMNGKYESLDGHPKEKEKEIVGVIFWELKSIYSRLWCFQLSLVALNFGEVTWKSLTRRFLRRHEDSYDAHVKVHSLTTYHNLLAKFGKLPTDLYALKLTKGFRQRFTPPPLSVSHSSISFSQHLAKQEFNTTHKLTTMWKTSWGVYPMGKPQQTIIIRNWWSQGDFSH